MSDIRIAFLGLAILFFCPALLLHSAPVADTQLRSPNAMNIPQALEAGKKLGMPVLVVFMDYDTTYAQPRASYHWLVNMPGSSNRQFVIAEVSLQGMDAQAAQIRSYIKGDKYPLFAFLDPDGNLFFGGTESDVGSERLEHERNSLLARCKPFPRIMQRRLQTAVNQAGILIDAREYQQAVQKINKTLPGLWYPQPVIARAKAMGEFCGQQGKQLLQQADASAGNVAQAMLLYDQVIDFCGPTCEEGRAAARAQRELQSKNAQAVKDYQLARPQKVAEWYLAQAQTLSDDNRLDAALMLCQVIARSYARTDVAPKAATLTLSLRDRIKQRSDAAGSSPDAAEPDYLPLGMSPPAAPSVSASPK